MKITDIVYQKKNPNRISIYLNGQFGFGLDSGLRFENKLEIDTQLSQAEVDELIEKDQVARLTEKILKFLSFRPRSEKEITDHFLYKAKLRDLSEIELPKYQTSLLKAIQKVKNLGLVNDRDFISWWIEQRNRFKPRGQRLLKLELVQKGIDRTLIEEFFTLEAEFEHRELALKAIEKKLPSLSKLPTLEFKKKVTDFLLRRGFDWPTIQGLIDTLKTKKYN